MILFYEHLIIIVVFAFLVGFLIAIPIGAVQIEVAKRAINDNLKSAYMVALGSVCSDVIYGFIASFSITSFLNDEKVKATLLFGSGILLAILSILTFKDVIKKNVSLSQIKFKTHHMSIITGFTMSFTNPLMVVFWIVYVQFSYDIGVIPYYNPIFLLVFVLFSGLGLSAYLLLLAKVLNHARKSFNKDLIKKINILLSFILAGFSVYFLIRSLQLFKLVM
ncbi:Transporter, LysE family [Desulfurella amilsii]|uniref:Transporter, LysE family n=1 Tax=Desulfurella amilsii TaxID=1562698 RepID=A0A1X4XW03_9BACT|nr:LysE family transporter [Desulfurella amilsii]OSS41688.1 Transporter, LysE family [Desulfurella amilsii]